MAFYSLALVYVTGAFLLMGILVLVLKTVLGKFFVFSLSSVGRRIAFRKRYGFSDVWRTFDGGFKISVLGFWL